MLQVRFELTLFSSWVQEFKTCAFHHFATGAIFELKTGNNPVSHQYQWCVISHLYDLSFFVVLAGFEPVTFWMSTKCSNQLSYRTISNFFEHPARLELASPGYKSGIINLLYKGCIYY